MLREQHFSRLVPEKHLYFSIPTTQDKIDKIVSKFVAREGRSIIPIQNQYLFPSCALSEDLQPLHQANCFANLFRKLCLALSESVSESFVHSYTDYTCLTLRKSEKARKASGQDGT